MSYSDLARDPRVDRQIRLLSKHHDVVTAGLAPPSLAELEFFDLNAPFEPLQGIMWRRIRATPGVAFRRFRRVHWAKPLQQGTKAALTGAKADLVLVNDVAGLPAAFEVVHAPRVILDAHEHAPTEYADQWTWRWVGGPYADWLCRNYLPRLAGMTAVSPGIADAYSKQYGVRCDVLINAPFRAPLVPQPVSQPIRLIHHGIGAPRRRLELLIEAARPLEGRFTLDLMLANGDAAYIRSLAEMARTSPHIEVIPPVPYEQIISRVNNYDVGVHLVPPGGVHDYYQLPNKIFEYIQGRVALAISPTPDMARVVRDYGCGVVTDAPTAEALTRALLDLDAERIAAFKQASHRAADILCAENNQDLLLSMVEKALTTGPVGAPASD